MTELRARRLAWAILVLEVVMIAGGVVFEALGTASAQSDWGGTGALAALSFFLAFSLFPLVGVVLATRRPSNAIGWILLVGVGGALALSVFLESYGRHALADGGPGGALAVSFTSWLWVPNVALAGTFPLLLFPDGHLPSPRWRWFAWFAAVGMVFTSLAILLDAGPLTDSGFPDVRNAFGIDAIEPILVVFTPVLLTIPIAIIGSAIGLVMRHRRGNPLERLQVKWLASAAVVVAFAYAIAMVASLLFGDPDPGWLSVVQTVAVASFALLPAAIGVAVLRYRLFEIDVVIRKTVAYALLVVFVTLVYVLLVVGVGTWVGRDSSFLTMVAAVLVALTFQPVRQVLTRFADRLVYGRRATPYEALTAFSARVGDTYASADLLPRMARVLGEATGARRTDVWLKVGDELRPTASWPSDAERPPTLAMANGELPGLPEADAAFPVRHQGELLGALALAKPPSDPLSMTDERLASDLAAQAGLVLTNARLTSELEGRIEELRAMHKRLVSAQDQERRRLERNIHDGAQQQLVGLSVRLRLAQSLVSSDPAKAEAALDGLRSQATEVLEDLRDLARGIYPPLLADQGLPAALDAQARRSVVPVDVRPDGVGRYSPEVEAAVYFSVLEALQNVAKYADATHVAVRLREEGPRLTFEVEDDGVGFEPSSTGYGTGLQGIADRLGALDGALEIRSAPAAGTVVTGWIPVESSA